MAALNGLPYQLLDNNALTGENIYRIRCLSSSGQVSYSNVVRVRMRGQQIKITAFPNPVVNRTFTLLLQHAEKGVYSIKLETIAGQLIFKNDLQNTGNISSHIIQIPSAVASGTYKLTVANESVIIHTSNIFVK